MNIKEIIAAERWQPFDRGTKPYVTAHNASLDRIEAAYQKEYAEWQEGDERLRRMHEEHLAEYDKRIAEIEAQLSRPKGLEDMAKLIIDWLYENGTPHTKVIIDQTSIEVVDGRMGIPIKPRD